MQNQHIIKSVAVNLDVDKRMAAEKVRMELLQRIEAVLKDRIEVLMDRICLPDEVIRIGKVQIDLGFVHPDEFDDLFLEKLEIGLVRAITKSKRETEMQELLVRPGAIDSVILQKEGNNQADQKMNVFVHYLNTGTLPWWNSFESKLGFQNYLRMEVLEGEGNAESTQLSQRSERLKTLVFNNKLARKRLVFDFDNETIKELISTWFKVDFYQFRHWNNWLRILFQSGDVGQTKIADKWINLSFLHMLFDEKIAPQHINIQHLVHAFMAVYIPEKGKNSAEKKMNNALQNENCIHALNGLYSESEQLIKELLRDYFSAQKHEDILSSQTVKILGNKKMDGGKKEEEIQNEEIDSSAKEPLSGIELTYAGVVILWPMLTTFFRNRGLLDQQAFKSAEHQLKALQLLNYLAAGHEELEPYEMALNKLLCGIPVNTPIILDEPLSEEDKEEVTVLLKHVISAWSILKSTSPEGLRQAFLERNGDLSEKPEAWQLNVEKKGMDIIMNKLPWGFNLIKLPWMDKLLQVEW